MITPIADPLSSTAGRLEFHFSRFRHYLEMPPRNFLHKRFIEDQIGYHFRSWHKLLIRQRRESEIVKTLIG